MVRAVEISWLPHATACHGMPRASQVMLAWEIDDNQWTLGTSRLFLKAGQLRALEELRDIGGQASQQVIKKIRQQCLGAVGNPMRVSCK